MKAIISITVIIATVCVYLFSRAFYRRFTSPFTLPLLIATIIIIIALLLFRIPYETYYLGGQILEKVLGPAVVALAYPLYRQFELLKKYFIAIVISINCGAIVGIMSGLLLSTWIGIDRVILLSILPKSVTTPVAMSIAETLGGMASLAAINVMIAGIGGVVLSPYLFKWFKITTDLGKGISIGSASHAIGTAKALENNETQGAASSVAMTLSAIVVAIYAPLLVFLFL